jgi:hypothetical protein
MPNTYMPSVNDDGEYIDHIPIIKMECIACTVQEKTKHMKPLANLRHISKLNHIKNGCRV